jgi:D-serine deaminase-like pyridoxal phosphate-dependent protein
MTLDQLDTPALIVDLDIMEANLRRAAEYAQRHGLRLRPHTKTHKSSLLGRRQLELGAAGLTVAKVGEAEVMLQANPVDLLIAYPVVGEAKLRRLCEVARQTAVTVALDSLDAARPLSEAARRTGVEIGVLAEVDMGLHRVGVRPEEAPGFAGELKKLPNLAWRGIDFYPGHIKALDLSAVEAIEDLKRELGRLLLELERVGLRPEIVSGGSTPTLFRSHEIAGMNEIRPGTYIFNDRNTVACGSCERSQCAATIVTTVVSTAVPGQMILDGGSKTFSSDRLSTGGDGDFGEVVGYPGARFLKMNEEHGFVQLAPGNPVPRVGERVQILPNHICVAVNLHETLFGHRGGDVEHAWKTEARGKLQ